MRDRANAARPFVADDGAAALHADVGRLDRATSAAVVIANISKMPGELTSSTVLTKPAKLFRLIQIAPTPVAVIDNKRVFLSILSIYEMRT